MTLVSSLGIIRNPCSGDLSGPSETDTVDPGRVAGVDQCAEQDMVAPSMNNEDAQEPREKSSADWAEQNKSFRRMVAAWLTSNPSSCLVILRLAMRVSVKLMRTFLHVAGENWEKQQQLKSLRGQPRTFRVVEAAGGGDVADAFDCLKEALRGPILALPLNARNNAFKVLAFRLLARLAGAMHLLLRLHRQLFPFKLFQLLACAPSERLEKAKEILAEPECLLDPGSKKVLAEYATPEKLSEDGFPILQALASMTEIDVVSIETRHAAVRRLLMSRQQTWGFAFEDICAEHLCRQYRTQLHGQRAKKKKRAKRPKKRRAAPKSSGKKRARRQVPNKPAETRSGGAQRAFMHLKLQEVPKHEWKRSRSEIFRRVGQEFRALTPEQRDHYHELGEAAKISKRVGGPGFAPSLASAASAAVNSGNGQLVATTQFQHDAQMHVRFAEQRSESSSRMALALQRAADVELQEHIASNPMDVFGVVDAVSVFQEAKEQVAPEPGNLTVGKWQPPLVALTQAIQSSAVCGFCCFCGCRV